MKTENSKIETVATVPTVTEVILSPEKVLAIVNSGADLISSKVSPASLAGLIVHELEGQTASGNRIILALEAAHKAGIPYTNKVKGDLVARGFAYSTIAGHLRVAQAVLPALRSGGVKAEDYKNLAGLKEQALILTTPKHKHLSKVLELIKDGVAPRKITTALRDIDSALAGPVQRVANPPKGIEKVSLDLPNMESLMINLEILFKADKAKTINRLNSFLLQMGISDRIK